MNIGRYIEDTHQRIHGGKVTDDAQWTLENTRQFVNNRFGMIVQADLDLRGDLQPGLLLHRDCILVDKEDPECRNCPRYYIELPFLPLSLSNDLGVFEVRRLSGKRVIRNPFRSMYPTNFKPKHAEYWHRIGNKIYLDGGKYTTSMKFSVSFIPDLVSAPGSTEFNPPTSVMERINTALQEIREKIYGPVDRFNDGEDIKQ